MTLEHSLTAYTKINSKWLKDLYIRHDTIKLLEENIGKRFSDINHSNIFLDQSPKAKETINRMKRQPTEWEKIFANHVTDEGLISIICKQLIQLNSKGTK